MQVPNMLFYNNQIKCGYVGDIAKVFLYSRTPFLFVDVKDGQETMEGTSFFNQLEAQVINELTDICLEQFSEINEINKQIPGVSEQRFQKSGIYVITPYNAQKNAIADFYAAKGMEEQVISIDSSQGREFDIVFVSMVRTKPGNFIQEYNRINVAITRAKHGLVIVGNARNLSRDQKWATLLRTYEANIVDGIVGVQQWINRQKVDYLRRLLGQ